MSDDTEPSLKVQGDQLYMAVCFWVPLIIDLSSVRVYSIAQYQEKMLQASRRDGDIVLDKVKMTFRDRDNILDILCFDFLIKI